MGRFGLPTNMKLKDGRTATIDFLKPNDSAKELMNFINAFVDEGANLSYDRKFTLKEENEWKKNHLKGFLKNESFCIIAKVDGKIAGTSDSTRKLFKLKDNVVIGLAIGKKYRGIGLGEILLRKNIEISRTKLNPKNLYLTVFTTNKPAIKLYRKLGLKEFARLPKWVLQKGKYVDEIYMKL
ncbi:GNAT family N-acetyltransferase [Candidatus Micrarchaeota archaeon]|nr:GNAT family N-acetyltransferase [Candidatus Micrarchaeota archaeon]